MTRYEWPPSPATTLPDDSAGRQRFNERHRELLERLLAVVPSAGDGLEPAPSGGPSRLAAPPVGNAVMWTPIGPSVVLDGQAGGRPRVSGRVRDLAVNDDGQRAYAATASGGVWYTDDSGTTWSPLGGWVTDANPAIGRSANALSCGCLLVQFGASPADDVVLVGTGELRAGRDAGRPGRRMRGVGVLRLGPPETTASALADPFGDPWRREAPNLAGHGIYRLARDPADPDRLVAATSAGLFTRSGPFTEDAPWARVSAAPFSFDADDGPFTTDVLWNPASADGTVPARLWVALVVPGNAAATAVYVSTNGVTGPWARVALAGATATTASRLGLAAAPSDRSVVYVLGSGPNLWRIDGTTPRVVAGLPVRLFGRSDQSAYDLAVAVRPDDPGFVLLGGSTLQADGEHSASLFRCAVQGIAGAGPYALDYLPANDADATADPTYVGNGVHADVHQVLWMAGVLGREVWVACDGGVFHSDRDGDRYSFVPANTGLAALETHFLGTHPTIESVVLAGTQDNGTLRRIGDTVWTASHLGDGGGLAVHRQRPLRYVYQYVRAAWRSNDSASFTRPVLRSSHVGNASETTESTASEFYSGADRHPGPTATQERVVVGTTRVWISEDWDPASGTAQTWGTLPSGAARAARDPRTGGAADHATDAVRGGPIVACRWVGPDRVVALGNRAVNVWSRAPAGTGTWTRTEISFHNGRTKSGGSYGNGDIEQPTSPVLPPLGAWSDVAVDQPGSGTHGSLYVATTGHATFDDDVPQESDRMDTLWWFDGTSAWHPTGLRNALGGTRAPAYAVVVDPGDATTVYAGTAIGVWQGVRADGAGGNPTWTWHPFNEGLPEASVEDLSVFSVPGSVKVLRAALRARGVWELDLSPVDPVPSTRTYLRVHADDHRMRLPSSLVDPASAADHDWGSSRDIAVRPSPLNPPPPRPTAPALPWSAATGVPAYDLWILQLAIHFTDSSVRANGVWDPAFTRRVQAYRTSFGLPAGASVDAAFWTTAVDSLAAWSAPWNGTEPTEADLLQLVVERRRGAPGPPRTAVNRHKTAVDVMVHRRHSRPLGQDEAGVVLLRRALTRAEGDGATVAVDDAWRSAVVDRLTGAASPTALPAGWELADPSGPKLVRSPLDARRPRAVSFTVDWAGKPRRSRWLIVAACSAPGDVITTAALAGASVRELVLGSHHVAVKRVEVI